MTQDQPGQAQGTGYVARGEVVPDDETEATQDEESGPMTRFKKVASALRGGRADQAAGDATRPNDVSAVRSPVAGSRDYWDDEQDVDATIPDSVPHTVPDEPRADKISAPGPSATGPGTYATSATADAANAGLRPGEATDRLGDFGDIAFGNLLPDAEQYTARWQHIRFRFVDDPQASVTEAADVVSQVTAKLEAAIQERQRAIQERQRAIQERASALRGRWGEGSNADTETLRETLRMYRAFMDQLIGPRP